MSKWYWTVYHWIKYTVQYPFSFRCTAQYLSHAMLCCLRRTELRLLLLSHYLVLGFLMVFFCILCCFTHYALPCVCLAVHCMLRCVVSLVSWKPLCVVSHRTQCFITCRRTVRLPSRCIKKACKIILIFRGGARSEASRTQGFGANLVIQPAHCFVTDLFKSCWL